MALQIRAASEGFVDTGTLGRWTGLFYSVNTIMGAGFLSFPWAFSHSGWLFALVFTAFSAFQSCVISLQLLDVMSRVEILMQLKEEGYTVPPFKFRNFVRSSSKDFLLPHSTNQPMITSRRVDFAECIRCLFGNTVGITFVALMILFLEGAMLAYAAIFASSFASIVPLGTLSTCNIYKDTAFDSDCRLKYWVWLTVYAIIVIQFTLRGLQEQRWFQSLMTLMRLLIIVVVIICCIGGAASQRKLDGDSHHSPTLPPPINVTYLGRAIPIIIFGLFFQLTMPTIAVHVKNKQENLRVVFFYSVIVCVVCYTFLGIVVPLAVDEVPSLSSLIFANYSGGYSQADKPWWAYAVTYLVVLFPALDVVSSFPLIGLALADNVLSLVYGNDPVLPPPKKGVYLVRLAICLPPLLLAYFVYNLGFILDWVGLLSLVLISIAVPLMQIAAKKMVDTESPYGTVFSHSVRVRQIYCYGLVTLSTVFLVIAAVENGLSESS